MQQEDSGASSIGPTVRGIPSGHHIPEKEAEAMTDLEHLVGHIPFAPIQWMSFGSPYCAHISETGHITALKLTEADMTSLPPTIDKRTHLKLLRLDDNEIEFLPETFGNLKLLDSLTLFGNPIRVLPSNCCQLHNLKRLVIVKAPLSELPADLGQLVNLHHLAISQTRYTLCWTR